MHNHLGTFTQGKNLPSRSIGKAEKPDTLTWITFNESTVVSCTISSDRELFYMAAHFLPVCDVLLESSEVEIEKDVSQHCFIHVNNPKHLKVDP